MYSGVSTAHGVRRGDAGWEFGWAYLRITPSLSGLGQNIDCQHYCFVLFVRVCGVDLFLFVLPSVFDLRFLVSVCGALLLLTGIKLVLRVFCDFSAFLFFLDFLSDVLMLSVLHLVFVVGEPVLLFFYCCWMSC